MLCDRISHSKIRDPIPTILLSIRLLCTHRFPVPTREFHSAREVYACNVKIGALSQSGKIQAARQLFDEMPLRDVVSWNSIITGHWQNGCFGESKRLFELMPQRNVVSWNSMITGSVEHDSIDDAYKYFVMMPERNIASWNAMISGFVKYDRVEEASRLFIEMPRRNVISYTAMINGYMQNGDIERAREVFDSMPCKNAVSWTVMISGYVENQQINEAKELFFQMKNKNIVAMTAMITGYCKEGKMGDARILFEGIQQKDEVSFNAMITGYAQNGISEEALNLYIEMLRSYLKPDNSTLISLLTASSTLASLKEAKQTHTLVVKYGFSSHLSVSNALITTYSKCGNILDSESAFCQINGPDLVTWNTIIAAFAQHGRYEKALGFFGQMESNGIKPDGITFLSILSVCCHSGRVTESEQWFQSMQNYQITPRSEHYACLVDGLSRAGKLEKAYNVILEMPFEGDLGVWGALLSGCRGNSNAELGVLSAMKVLELDPKNSGAYVVLSNIYAARGMWREVVKVRGLMKENGVKKQTAFSWIEIENRVFYFAGGDVSHPYIEKIHLVLKWINLHMKLVDDSFV